MTEEWKSPNFRKNMRSYISKMLPEHGLEARRKALVMESHIFRKARTKYEYLKLVAKLSVHYQRKAQRKSEQQQQQDQQ